MPYNSQASLGRPIMMPQSKGPMTPDDIEERQAKLDAMGLGDSLAGQLNQWAGKMVAQKSAAKDSILESTGAAAMKSSALSGVGGAAAAL